MAKTLNIVAAGGLAVGAILGMAGTFVPDAGIRTLLWTIDGASLVAATAILAVTHARQGKDIVASGFLVFAIGEAVVMSGSGIDLTANLPAFGAGTALWAVALLFVSLPRHFAWPTRLLGVAAALLFAIAAGRIAWGEQLLATSEPLPGYAYPVLVATFVGWIVALLREPG